MKATFLKVYVCFRIDFRSSYMLFEGTLESLICNKYRTRSRYAWQTKLWKQYESQSKGSSLTEGVRHRCILQAIML